MSKVIKGFKAMNADMTCRDKKFKIGKTYKLSTIQMCSQGFHFCENLFDVYEYYPKSSDTVICEIEASGEILKEGNKSCSSVIKIVKRLSDKELITLWINRTNSGNGNSGNWNSGNGNNGNGNNGNWNSGNRNSGDWNSGDGNSGNGNNGNWNSGYGNSGYGNSGDGNSGDGNSGDGNSGYRNSGNRNSGYGNSGNRNSGDWNSGDGNSGYFNTIIPVYLFNKPSKMKYTKEFENRIRSLNVKPILEWISESLMTEKEKTDNPSYKTTGGTLRKTDRFDFRYLTDEDKNFIKSLPNFNDNVFKQISGVSLKTVKGKKQ